MNQELGKLLSGGEQRDAIHLAIAPVEAAEKLLPGQHVGIYADGRAGTRIETIGIVDPFLEGVVNLGQRFWLCLYPNTVTGMRHHWSHPAFGEQATPADLARQKFDDKEASWAWMREYAEQHWSHRGDYSGWDGKYTAEQLIEFATDYLKTGDKHIQQGSESLRDSMYESGTNTEFWRHFAAITGIAPAGYMDDLVPFCCTC